MSAGIVDLRSDTVTRPSAAMRAAMVAADVGDDVLGEDPTVKALEERAAAFLGVEAALFVPSGSMANQIALLCHCVRGDEVLVGEGAHTYWHESGAAGAIAGVQILMLGHGGLFCGDDVRRAYKADDHSHPPTRLVCVENTHNRGGGLIWSADDLGGVVSAAKDLGLGTHLDGARLANASVATGRSAAALAAGFDTVSFCFSKGLGAPVGSVIAGARATMSRAHRFRKMLGGGMRQAGVLAAAALHALEHNVGRLAEDHAHARLIAERLANVRGLGLLRDAVKTNIVAFDLPPPLPSAHEVVARLAERGILASILGERRMRLVTHLDVDRPACERAAEAVTEILRS